MFINHTHSRRKLWQDVSYALPRTTHPHAARLYDAKTAN